MTTPNDSRDFYPTPDNLAWEMAYSLQSTKYGWKHLPQPILEPSAGDGALARQIHAVAEIRHDPKTGELDRYSTSKAKEFDLDCVELSSDFRAKLKKDGFRVVHDDFLTFRPAKKYAAIIMNPPFSAGAAHLLKALEIMKDGGKIRCLLNAETIRNPYTNERKELVQKLDELNAQIKYIPDAFKNARRAARVEVALISIDIPDKEPVSKIRLELHNEMTDRMKDDPQLAALVSADPIAAAVERYLVKEYATDGRDLDGAAIFDRKTNCCTHLFGCAKLSVFSVDVAARSTPRRYPDMPAASTIYYFIYCKGPGDQHFTLCDPWGGRRGMNKVFAPRFTKDQADKVVVRMTERNPGFIFQRRPAR